MLPTTGRMERGPLLKLMCHGDPERCYKVKGRPMPLCARCISFYPFMALTAILTSPLFILIDVGSLVVTASFIILVAPLVIDGLLQYSGLRRSNNPLRTITGVLGGSGCGLALSYISVRTIGFIMGN